MVKLVVLISGKRKSGKDYCCKVLKRALEPLEVSIHGVSHSLKKIYANNHGLDYSQLISDGPYKETHRLGMIKWGESIRDAEPDFFCRLVPTGCQGFFSYIAHFSYKLRATIPSTCSDDVVIISDCRRPTDIEYFQTNYRTLTVRIEASIEERVRRGFMFTEGIDDMPSECALDEYEHDMTIVNDQSRDFSREIENVTDHIRAIL
ncbi:putative phosphomevalonate kinase [Ancylostoma caninum]|uniref:Phosphomevalonate kinase n=1 Tax=Ancylostoma caninum TaxID=29170 RepID=A0A368G242_ANCCA|nr:putative phosphomevalonate kinase [Ancylostoma caninum]